MPNSGYVPKSLLRGYVTAMFILVMTAFAITMSVVIHYEHKDADRAQTLSFKIADQATENHTALCSFKLDLQRRVKDTEDYIAEHPNGLAGIPVATIRNSIANQRATIDSLSSLKC